MKTTGKSFQMTSGSVQGVQEREQDIWKKVCEQLTDITSGMSEEEKQDYEKKIRAKLQRGANLSVEELNYLRIHNPELYRSAMRVKTAKQQLKEQLRHCKSKQEANTLIVRSISRISDKDPDKTYLTAGLRKVAEEFKKNHPDGAELSFNQKVDIWYGEHAQNLSRESLLIQAEKWFNATHSRMSAALEKLKKKQTDFENAGKLKHYGDLILSYSYLLDKNSSFLECEDYESGKTVRILVDPKKNAQENAAEYYEKYKKAQSGAESLKHDIELACKKIEKVEKMYQEMQNEKNPVRIEQLLRKDTTPKQQKKKEHPGLDFIVNGWYILAGRDANENDELLRHHVRGSDMWFHVRDFPGGYVFVKNRPGKTIPLDILLDAANLAVYYSKARNSGKTDLYYTQVKYLRRAKNGPKGLVIPTQEKNLCITPDKERLRRLDSIRQENEL